MDTTSIALVLAAIAVGALVGSLLGRSGAAGVRERLAAERRAAEQHVTTLEQAHATRLADLQRAAADQLDAERSASEQQLARLERAHEDRVAELQRTAAEQLEAERAGAQFRLVELRSDHKRLADEFEALSRRALEANTRAFLEQAEERLTRSQVVGAAELAKREQAVRSLVEPLSRTLGEVKAEVSAAERSRLSAHAALAEQVEQMRSSSDQLRNQTGLLVTALRAPQVRGRWGELHLRRVVEAAGMVEHVDFEEQETVMTDDGALRPDLIVKLPGGKRIVVDAKVAFNGYLEAMEAKDDTVRANRLLAHARHLRQHIDDLGGKAYWEHVAHSPEFVVMFIPAENFLNAALEQDPTLMERAFERNVVLATPATLVALLRTVGYTWRQEVLAAEAQQVFTVGRELHKRLGTLGGHLTTMSKRLNATVDAFNRLNSSLDSQVVTQARRFSALQGLEPALDAAPPVEVLAVPAHKLDLYADERHRVLDEGGDATVALIETAQHDALARHAEAGPEAGPDADADPAPDIDASAHAEPDTRRPASAGTERAS